MVYAYRYEEITHPKYGASELIARMLEKLEEVSNYGQTFQDCVKASEAYKVISETAQELHFYAQNMSTGYDYIAEGMGHAFEPPELGEPAPEDEPEEEEERLTEETIVRVMEAIADEKFSLDYMKPDARRQVQYYMDYGTLEPKRKR